MPQEIIHSIVLMLFSFLFFILQVDMTSVPRSSLDVEHDGFYLLKKDSQRRLTLSRVLEQDSEKICHKWMLSVQQDFGNTLLTMVSDFDYVHDIFCGQAMQNHKIKSSPGEVIFSSGLDEGCRK